MEGSSSFTVKTHDLGEGLSNNHFESLVKEISKTNSIFVEVSGDKTLISSVEEWVETSCSADLSNLLPLSKSWIDTSWVMGTSVKKNDGSWGGVVKILHHSVEIKTFSLLVEISIFSYFKSRSLENLIVISPSWITHIDW